MAQERNIFGGGNKNSLYTPMSEVEQEVIQRLIDAQDLRVHILGWGVVNNPRIVLGDLRLGLTFRLHFNAPEPPGIPLYYLDLELRTGSGILLFKSRESLLYGGKPVMAAAGVYFDMVWDIAIKSVDPKVIRAIKPDATGFTSRLQDKDTKEMTLTGNMKLSPKQLHLLRKLRRGDAFVKQLNREKLIRKP